MNSKLQFSLLYDFYGDLLNDSQRQAVELYVNEDLSLAEVAELLGISRQGVRDSLNRAERKLNEFDSKLGLLNLYRQRREHNDTLRALVSQMKETEGCDKLMPQLKQIEDLLREDV